MTMQSSYRYEEYDTYQDPSMKRQQRRPSMMYERRTSLSLMPAFYDSSYPTSVVEMREEIACIDTSPSKASRRRSLGISMHDLCELTGDSIFESFGDSSSEDPFESLPKDLQNFNSNSNSNSWTSSELSNQIRVLRRTSLSFMPICSDTDIEEKEFDAALDIFFHEQASDIQHSGPVSVPASALVQSPFDPSNPLYSVEFANFAKDYQGRLKELAGQMETSEKSRSKVAMVKMLLVRNQKKERFTRKLAATGLNTTKSEETRKMLLKAHYLNLTNKAYGTGTRSPMNVPSSSSTCNVNAKPISYAAIKDARRKNSTTRNEEPAARQVSMDTTVNFDDAVPSAPCSSSGMNMHMNTHMTNSNPLFTARRVSRRRSSLAIQSFQMQFFPDSM
jgi:hypothetical protein